MTSSRAEHPSGPADLRVVRKQAFDVANDMQDRPPGGGRAVLRDVGSQRNQVLDRLRRPDDGHLAVRFGAGLGEGRSRLRPRDLTQLLTAFVSNALAAIERPHGALDAGDLPLVQIEIFVERFGREIRALRPVLLASLSSRFVGVLTMIAAVYSWASTMSVSGAAIAPGTVAVEDCWRIGHQRDDVLPLAQGSARERTRCRWIFGHKGRFDFSYIDCRTSRRKF
jgi:hypothetical protein